MHKNLISVHICHLQTFLYRIICVWQGKMPLRPIQAIANGPIEGGGREYERGRCPEAFQSSATWWCRRRVYTLMVCGALSPSACEYVAVRISTIATSNFEFRLRACFQRYPLASYLPSTTALHMPHIPDVHHGGKDSRGWNTRRSHRKERLLLPGQIYAVGRLGSSEWYNPGRVYTRDCIMIEVTPP